MDSHYPWVLYLQIHRLLKLIYSLKINTPGAFVVTRGHTQGPAGFPSRGSEFWVQLSYDSHSLFSIMLFIFLCVLLVSSVFKMAPELMLQDRRVS